MASKGQLTGMRGVYLVAAELAARGFIASPTSRSAAGADLLVTDQEQQRAFSVDVKTNGKPASFWLVGARTEKLKSPTHVYVFVNLRKSGQHDFFVVPSEVVAANVKTSVSASGKWYEFHQIHGIPHKDGWRLFGEPQASIPE